jgi:hypothetical protein
MHLWPLVFHHPLPRWDLSWGPCPQNWPQICNYKPLCRPVCGFWSWTMFDPIPWVQYFQYSWQNAQDRGAWLLITRYEHCPTPNLESGDHSSAWVNCFCGKFQSREVGLTIFRRYLKFWNVFLYIIPLISTYISIIIICYKAKGIATSLSFLIYHF